MSENMNSRATISSSQCREISRFMEEINLIISKEREPLTVTEQGLTIFQIPLDKASIVFDVNSLNGLDATESVISGTFNSDGEFISFPMIILEIFVTFPLDCAWKDCY